MGAINLTAYQPALLNGLNVTATTGTLTLASGKTLTVSNTLSFTGTDASAIAFGTGGTVLYNGGALGTPATGNLSNCTALPAGSITGLGAGVATALAIALNAAGGLAPVSSPSLVTPNINVATATSLTIGGATIGSNALAVTGSSVIGGLTIPALNSTILTITSGAAAAGIVQTVSGGGTDEGFTFTSKGVGNTLFTNGNIGVGVAVNAGWAASYAVSTVGKGMALWCSRTTTDSYFTNNAYFSSNYKAIQTGPANRFNFSGNGNMYFSTAPSAVADATLTFTDRLVISATDSAFTTTITQTSASATAFVSGPNGSTNPVFQIVNNVASQADGVSITGNAAGVGVTFASLSSGSNAPINLRPKGTGTVSFQDGARATPSITFASSAVVGFWYDSGTIRASFNSQDGVQFTSTGCSVGTGGLYDFAGDSAISRISAGLLGIGTGAQGSFAGSIKATNFISNGVMRFKGYTVATLPAGTVGDNAYVTDALAPTFLATVVGGGAIVTPVFYNGSAWVGA